MIESLSESNAGFGAGFVSALILIAVLILGAHVAQWIATYPMPKAVVVWLTAPRISVLELAQIPVFLVIGYAVVWAVAYGPRFR